MNHNQTSRTRQIATVAFTAAFVAIVTATASPATAQHARGGSSTVSSEVSAMGYARPLDALGGRTLAEYVQEHLQDDRRIAAAF